jgi:hypothetical protein
MRSSGLNRRYVTARNRLRRELSLTPGAMALLRPLRQFAEPLLFHLNRGRPEQIFMSEELQWRLEKYYADEPARLSALLDRPSFDWSDPNI